jgi:hypothetical protein
LSIGTIDPPPSRRGHAWLLGAAVALTCLLLCPFAVTPIPPLLDYPDHVAEMYVIAQASHDLGLAKVYAIHWTVVANSGVELVMPFLLRFLPLWPTGDGFLVLTLLLPLAGSAIFARAAFARWSFWPLAGGLVAYNTLFLLGFMNFLIGIGAAFLAAAAWVAYRSRFPVWTVAGAIPAAIALFFIHLFGLMFFALLIGAHELTALIGPRGRRWPTMGLVLRRLLPDAVIFVLPVLLLLGSTLADTSGATMRQPLNVKIGELFYPFLTYYQTPDRLVMLALLAAMAVLLWRGRARVAPQAVIVLLVMLAVWPFVPHVYKNTGYIDARFPIMMGYLLFAGFEPLNLPRRVGAALFAVIALLIVVRVGAVGRVWAGHNQDLAELNRVIAHVEPGSQVLAVDVPSQQVTPYWLGHRRNWMNAGYIKTYYHDAALLIPERQAFWPRLFTGLGKQPVVVNPAYTATTAPEGELPDYHELSADQPSAAALVDAPYLQDWQRKFAYVLLLASGAAGDVSLLRPDRLELVEQTEFATLFRIRHAPKPE